MKGFRLSHLMRVSFGPLRHFMQYIQEAHPARLKKIMVVNTSSLINQIMTLVKPLIRSELMGLLTFISEGPESVLPLKLLPSDYGGSLPEVAVSENRKNILIYIIKLSLKTHLMNFAKYTFVLIIPSNGIIHVLMKSLNLMFSNSSSVKVTFKYFWTIIYF